jgi:hypothetical protein
MLKVLIAADNRADARELVERMEASKGFHGTFIGNEIAQQSKDTRAGTPSVRFEIDAEYIPPKTLQPRTKEGI